jgi:hypothetical protein
MDKYISNKHLLKIINEYTETKICHEKELLDRTFNVRFYTKIFYCYSNHVINCGTNFKLYDAIRRIRKQNFNWTIDE